jgi:hypothetical protein
LNTDKKADSVLVEVRDLFERFIPVAESSVAIADAESVGSRPDGAAGLPICWNSWHR